MRNIILLELNEVPWRIIDYYAAQHPDSASARILNQSIKYETCAEDPGHLSPWKTWPTLHRGVTSDKHGLADFGAPLDEADESYPPIWSILASHGVKVGIFGSLHSYPPDPRHCFHVPDPFAPRADCLPRYLEPFQDFCLKMSRESARNVSRSIPLLEATRFLSSLPRLGITASTYWHAMRQLASERVNRWKSVRRRAFQSVLGFDVFMKQLTTHKPQFCTFFTNHVASAMHGYWAATFPGDYATATYDAQWIQTFKEELLFAMGRADAMIGRLMRFVDANPAHDLIIASSMGQQAVRHEAVETQLWITSPSLFFTALGLRAALEEKPAMFPQYNFSVVGNGDEVEQALRSVSINGQQLKFRRNRGFFSLDFGHENTAEVKVAIGDRLLAPEQCGLSNLQIEDRSTSSAYHVPQGSMLVYGPGVKSSVSRSRVSTLEIAPYVLHNFGISPPSYMKKTSLSFR